MRKKVGSSQAREHKIDARIIEGTNRCTMGGKSGWGVEKKGRKGSPAEIRTRIAGFNEAAHAQKTYANRAELGASR